MPRTAGVSSSKRDRWRRLRPRPISVANWSSVRPMGLPTCVTLILAPPLAASPLVAAMNLLLRARRGCCRGIGVAAANDVADLLAALGGDGAGADHAVQRVERGLDHVVRVGRADRFRHHVLEPEALEDRAQRATGDDSGSRLGGAQIHLAGAIVTGDVVVQRAALAQRHPDHAPLGLVGRLADGLGHLARLAGAIARAALAVADHDHGGEAEPPAALHDFGHAVDTDQLFDEFGFLAVAVALAAPTATLAAPTASAAPLPAL